ncbi:MAG: PepSY-associated TM helix domain-containing protein [Pseudomonadota bacterium]
MAIRERQIRIYDLHSWTGIALGWFLYVVCFSGTVAVFVGELRTWEDPTKRLAVPEEIAPINDTFSEWIEEKLKSVDGDEEKTLSFLRLNFPQVHEPFYSASIGVQAPEGESEFHEAHWHAQTGEPLPVKGEGMSEWLRHFHHDLMWPEYLGGGGVGLIIVGLSGLVLMLNLISGVVAHTKIKEEFFTLRYWRSTRLRWQDTHKVIGLWSFPFSAMISITGAFFGVGSLLLPVIALVMFKGNVETVANELGFGGAEPAGEYAEMISVDEIARWRDPETNIGPYQVRIQNYEDAGAVYEVYFRSEGKLKYAEALTVNGATGETVEPLGFNAPAPGNRAIAAVSVLHFGNFGGIPVKLLYFVLGILLVAIVAFGNMMWTERRLHGSEGRRSPKFYRGLSRANAGITLGFPLASVALFYADKLLFNGAQSHIVLAGQVYFLVVGAALIYAFVRANEYRTTVELLVATGALSVGVPALNWAATGDLFLSQLLSPQSTHAWVDFSLLVMGVLTIVIALKLPKGRPSFISGRQPQENADTVLSAAE